MANCTLTAGIPLACLESTGGIKNVYITPFLDTTTFVEASGVISAATNMGDVYGFKFRINF